MGASYKDAGVDIEAGDALVERIKPHAVRTRRSELLAGVGGFGGLFAIPPGKYREPVLVSGTDGVGTKLKLAFALDQHATVGVDLVAMSVNDVLCCGAEPLFFLDYFATSKLDVTRAEKVIAGIAEGCVQAGCSLLGGETAELPGFYAPGDYELAGFCVGIVEKAKILDGARVRPGDALIGLSASGLHSNGFSLARKVLEDSGASLHSTPEGWSRTLGAALLEPTRIYVKDVLALLEAVEVRGLAHITGSGIPGNLPRCLPDGLTARLQASAWTRPPIFDWLEQTGGIAREEMFSTFNMGLGLIAVVPQAQAEAAVQFLAARGQQAFRVGQVEAGAAGREAVAVIEA